MFGVLRRVILFAALGPKIAWLKAREWVWFSALFAVAVGVAAVNEFGLAAALLSGSALAAASQVWTWHLSAWNVSVERIIKSLATVFIAVVLVAALLIDNHVRDGRPWTQLPDAIATFDGEVHPRRTPFVWRDWTPQVDWSANPGPVRVIHSFPAKPLILLDFSKFTGGSVQNLSNEPLYILNLSTKVEMPMGDDVYSLPIDKIVEPHKTVAFTSTQQGSYSAPESYLSSDWEKTLVAMQAQYKQCLHPVVFVPDAPALREIAAHFAKKTLPCLSVMRMV